MSAKLFPGYIPRSPGATHAKVESRLTPVTDQTLPCPVFCSALHRGCGRHSASRPPCLIPEQGLKEPDYPPGRFLQVQQRGAGGAAGGQDRRAGGPSGERGEVSWAQPWCRGPGGQWASHYKVLSHLYLFLSSKACEEGRASTTLLENCSHCIDEKTETHQSK